MFFYNIFGAFLRWTGPGEEALFCINNHVGKAKTQIVHRLTKFDHINIGLGHIISTLECNILNSFELLDLIISSSFSQNGLVLIIYFSFHLNWTGFDHLLIFLLLPI